MLPLALALLVRRPLLALLSLVPWHSERTCALSLQRSGHYTESHQTYFTDFTATKPKPPPVHLRMSYSLSVFVFQHPFVILFTTPLSLLTLSVSLTYHFVGAVVDASLLWDGYRIPFFILRELAYPHSPKSGLVSFTLRLDCCIR